MDRSRSVRRSKHVGRRLSRRLSLVARAGLARFRTDTSLPKRLDITLIAPDKTQRYANTSNGGTCSQVRISGGKVRVYVVSEGDLLQGKQRKTSGITVIHDVARRNTWGHIEMLPEYCSLCDMDVNEDTGHFIGDWPIQTSHRHNYFGYRTLPTQDVYEYLNGRDWEKLWGYLKEALKYRQELVSGEAGCTVESLLAPICAEFRLLGWPLVRLAGSQAEVDPGADLALLEAEIVIVDPRPHSILQEGRRGLCADWERAERTYISRLRSALPLYGSPLSQVGILAPAEFSAVFGPLQALADRAHAAADKMKGIVDNWDEEEKTIGSVFSAQFWDQYDHYQDVHRKSKQLLREKSRLEEDFEELVRLRRGAALFGLQDLLRLPVQRLSQYEEYLEALVKEAHRERLREDEDIQTALLRAKQAVKRAKEESDLERIQDLFPNDSLKLYEKDVLTMRMKGLMRKRPSPAARLTRALSAKSLRPESPPPRPPQQAHRHFIMESPVQFTTGVQSQDRHLFLFNDLLLIAKARSGGNFKLKDKVRVSEVWLSTSGLEEVSELLKSRDTSFIIGWPTTNVVATFSTQAARDLWLSKLNEVVNMEKSKEPSYTNIQVTYYDQATNIEYVKTLSVSPEETARGAMLSALSALDLPRTGHQLWAQSAREESPYPLIGHERPAAIKLSCLRDALSAEEGFDLDHCNNIHDPLARCQFILRNVCKSPESLEKKRPKKISGRMRIGQVFRRSLSKETPGCLFGLPLSRVCQGDNLPPTVISMLQVVATKGPFTVGMFRKSANVRFVRELRSKLDAGQSVPLDSVPVLAVGALLKDFLRSLPDPLLTTALYPRWRAAVETPNLHQRLIRIKSVVEELPRANRVLLRYVLCTLVLIARRCNTNLMSPANLGVCVGPSLLWQSAGSPGDLRAVPALVEALITHAEVLVGPNVCTLLGDPRDSGTEESDSLRRDDSSIDSLECSPPPRKDKISLSRDSGLTMSDSQLYTPDEEESTSTSSSGYDPAFDQHAKVTATVSVPGEYVRVYGGWEERLNPNFQRQAWFRQRSRRLNSVPNQVHSASQDDLLGRPTSLLQTPISQRLEARSASQESVHQPPVRCEVISEPRRARYRPPAPPPLTSSSTKEDSSTLSDEDCTPHVSRSNSRGNEVVRLRHLPPVHVESAFLRGRLRRRDDRPAHRSRSLPPAPPTNKRAPITSYYLPDYMQTHSIVTSNYRDEESYV